MSRRHGPESTTEGTEDADHSALRRHRLARHHHRRAGFIGSNLAAAFLRDGRQVTVLDSLQRPGSERNLEWYRSNRDLTRPDYCDLIFYDGWPDAEDAVRAADAVVVGSYVPDGSDIIDWLSETGRPLFFYEIDTPITLTGLQRDGQVAYLRADQIPLFEVYFSFTGGPALAEIEQRWRARRAEALYCAVDPLVYHPAPIDARFSCRLGYMGTYAADRQLRLENLLIETARKRPNERFLIA
jgi:spore maturation protein CgeB